MDIKRYERRWPKVISPGQRRWWPTQVSLTVSSVGGMLSLSESVLLMV